MYKNFMEIHSVVVELLQCGPQWWTWTDQLYAASMAENQSSLMHAIVI